MTTKTDTDLYRIKFRHTDQTRLIHLDTFSPPDKLYARSANFFRFGEEHLEKQIKRKFLNCSRGQVGYAGQDFTPQTTFSFRRSALAENLVNVGTFSYLDNTG